MNNAIQANEITAESKNALPSNLDPILFEVVRNALVAATEEMATALRRSAYSTNVKTRNDFSCAFFDRDLRVTAQAFTQPVHLGSFVKLVPNSIRTYGLQNLQPGDMLVTNDPYGGGSHLNDVTIIAPVFFENTLAGYLSNLVHHVDVGGGAPASIGAFQEIYQEGIIIPPVKLVSEGKVVDDVFRLMLAQMRSKRETAGDFRAQIAANVTGTNRLHEIIERLSLDGFNNYIDALISYTSRRTRHEISKLPQGTFGATGSLDNDGFTNERVQLSVSMTIDDAGVLFDTSGSDMQRRAPVNSTYAQTFSACAYALKCLIDQDVPINHGFYEWVRLEAPEGTVTNCRPPAPVVGGWETNSRVTDIIFKALAPVLPDQVIAGTKGMMCQVGFGVLTPHEYYCFYEALGGGYGGRATKDGPDAVQAHGQNTENAPIEEIEANYPVRVLRYELIPDSGGPGRQRGGLGLRRDYQFPHHDATFTLLADRDYEGPWGLFDGASGTPAAYLRNPDGEALKLNSKSTVALKQGEVISYQTCGGGGYGAPFVRDSALVLDDVRNGKVSIAQAESVYGVIIDATNWIVDETATRQLRTGDSRRTA